MAYDEQLADRIRGRLGEEEGVSEKKMFGGLAFLLNGNMCCGIHRESLMVRMNPADTDDALSQPHTRIFDMTGRPMKGWILVDPGGLEDDEDLARWLKTAKDFASTLPAK